MDPLGADLKGGLYIAYSTGVGDIFCRIQSLESDSLQCMHDGQCRRFGGLSVASSLCHHCFRAFKT